MHALHVVVEQAVSTEPGTFFQLINPTDRPCAVRYIVTPAFLSEKSSEVIYDDLCVLEESWEELEAAGCQPKVVIPTKAERQAAEQRVAEKAIQSRRHDEEI